MQPIQHNVEAMKGSIRSYANAGEYGSHSNLGKLRN